LSARIHKDIKRALIAWDLSECGEDALQLRGIIWILLTFGCRRTVCFCSYYGINTLFILIVNRIESFQFIRIPDKVLSLKDASNSCDIFFVLSKMTIM
jgi:hypothetical protein